ncbi:uncharacterized protein KIAA0513-like [Watersipora subatra]|uniref:uncharacterized protein KIAA0513-like n=1 Tax=Watersipora subatra TaxID=2589382 RepID=UPI00355BA7DE
MDFIKRRLSMNADPDKDKEDKPIGNLFESLSTKRASLWNDFTSKIKSTQSTPDDQSEGDPVTPSPNASTSASFMNAVKQKLQGVGLYENGQRSTGLNKTDGEPECAPLIDTADCSSGDESDAAVCGASETSELVINSSETDGAPSINCRKKLSKRQDSVTAEEVYLDTVASHVKNGLMPPDSDTSIVSPSTAVQEFVFAEHSRKSKSAPSKKSAEGAKASNNHLALPNGNLINFDSMQNLSQAATSRAETVVHREEDQVLGYESSGDESSEPIYTEHASKRSCSLGSLNSISSSFEDDESMEVKVFATRFVGNIFSGNSNSSEDKAKFGKCVQDGNFRLHFARAISQNRGTQRAVTEHTFYQLVQYFAVVLFECDEADDFTPATILMNMCFTFFYEVSQAGKVQKNFLFSYLKNQPIWQSMRYWNAAFYESVQNERERKPLTTNKDDADDEDQDRKFQRNVIFGQLGTFLYNMRAFGLEMDWCLEFLRKQSTIGDLTDEQRQILKESMECMSQD